MATYILLTRFTPQGVENIKDSPGRLETAKKAIAELGAELVDFYLVMGQYDAVVVIEAPDDETVAKASIAIASQGNVRMETLRAFGEAEYRKIVKALP